MGRVFRAMKLGGGNMNSYELKEKLKKISKVEIGNFPTPLQRIRNFEKKNNLSNLYIKRDDMCESPGGNKIRHLKYLMGYFLHEGYDVFIMPGSTLSNFAMMAAMICKRMGIRCILLHSSPRNNVLRGNSLLSDLMGAERIYLGDVTFEEEEAKKEELLNELKKAGKKPLLFGTGYSEQISTVGYIDAMIELTEQAQRENKKITNVFVPGGTGCMASGVIFGAGALDRPFHINVVSVEFHKDILKKRIENHLIRISEVTGIKLKYSLDEMATVHGG